MAVAHPYGKSVWPREVVRIDLRNGRNTRHSGYCDLNPSGHDYGEDRDTGSDQDGRANPNAESTIRWMVNGLVRCIELNHAFPPLTTLSAGHMSESQKLVTFSGHATVRRKEMSSRASTSPLKRPNQAADLQPGLRSPPRRCLPVLLRLYLSSRHSTDRRRKRRFAESKERFAEVT